MEPSATTHAATVNGTAVAKRHTLRQTQRGLFPEGPVDELRTQPETHHESRTKDPLTARAATAVITTGDHANVAPSLQNASRATTEAFQNKVHAQGNAQITSLGVDYKQESRGAEPHI